MTGLPIAARVREVVRFAEVDAPVIHVPGAQDIVPRAKSHKASPLLIRYPDAIEPGPSVTRDRFRCCRPARSCAGLDGRA